MIRPAVNHRCRTVHSARALYLKGNIRNDLFAQNFNGTRDTWLITTRKRSCRKVMFSRCVPVHGRGGICGPMSFLGCISGARSLLGGGYSPLRGRVGTYPSQGSEYPSTLDTNTQPPRVGMSMGVGTHAPPRHGMLW